MTVLSSIQRAALDGLETTVNGYLRLDPATPERMAELQGKMIEIRLRPLDLRFFVLPGSQGVQITSEADRDPDTIISGTPLALARTGINRKAASGLFSEDVQISGDVEAGRQLKAALDAMDIDWEEQLSRLLGDVLAHHIGNVARGLRDWSEQAARTMQDNVGEYLQEEIRLLPSSEEVDELMSAVDRLRADVDRLEQRIERMETRMGARRSSRPSPGDAVENSGPEDGG